MSKVVNQYFCPQCNKYLKKIDNKFVCYYCGEQSNPVIKKCLTGRIKTNIQNFYGTDKERINRIYHLMKYRCYNKNCKFYNIYGGRGIVICDKWLGKNGFKNFYKWSIENGYNKNLTIDRINNDAEYSPQNCKWSTRVEQNNNRRNSVKYSLNGEKLSLSELSRKVGISRSALESRINKYGWSLERAIQTPTRKRKLKGDK